MQKIYSNVVCLAMTLLSFGVGFIAHGQNVGTIQIGSGSGSTPSLPINPYWGYNYSQQIVTASEFIAGNGAIGQITKIRFYCTKNDNPNGWNNWTVYLGHTNKNSFVSNTDWVAFSDLTEVFSGDISTVSVGSWHELTFTTPFNYTGGNLVVAVQEVTPGLTNSDEVRFASYEGSSNQAIVYRSDSSIPDPTNPPTASFRESTLAQIQFEGTLGACPAPTALSIPHIKSSLADISWTAGGTETSWNIAWGTLGFTPGDANEIGNDVVTNTSFTITGLTPNTSYQVYVQADCGVDSSMWAGPYVFTTPQTPATLPYTDDFTSNNWILSNGTQLNQWHVGSATGNPANALYISNDNGVTNAYTTADANKSIVHASKTFYIPTGNLVDFQFDWKGMGEGSSFKYDFMRVWILHASATLTPGVQISTINTPGAIQLGGSLNQQSTWRTETFTLPSSLQEQ